MRGKYETGTAVSRQKGNIHATIENAVKSAMEETVACTKGSRAKKAQKLNVSKNDLLMIGEIVAQVMLGVEPLITSDRGRLVREIKRDTGVNTVWTIDGRIFCTQYEDCCEVKRFVACHMQSARVRYNQNKRTAEWKNSKLSKRASVETKEHKVKRNIGMLFES